MPGPQLWYTSSPLSDVARSTNANCIASTEYRIRAISGQSASPSRWSESDDLSKFIHEPDVHLGIYEPSLTNSFWWKVKGKASQLKHFEFPPSLARLAAPLGKFLRATFFASTAQVWPPGPALNNSFEQKAKDGLPRGLWTWWSDWLPLGEKI